MEKRHYPLLNRFLPRNKPCNLLIISSVAKGIQLRSNCTTVTMQKVYIYHVKAYLLARKRITFATQLQLGKKVVKIFHIPALPFRTKPTIYVHVGFCRVVTYPLDYPSRKKSRASFTSSSVIVWSMCISPMPESNVTFISLPVFFLSWYMRSISFG